MPFLLIYNGNKRHIIEAISSLMQIMRYHIYKL